MDVLEIEEEEEEEIRKNKKQEQMKQELKEKETKRTTIETSLKHKIYLIYTHNYLPNPLAASSTCLSSSPSFLP